MSTDSHIDSSSERDGTAAKAKKSELDGKIESARQRADRLSHQVGESPSATGNLVLQAIEELRKTLEELKVAEEELREQNEELLATRAELEAERKRYEDLFEFAPDGYVTTDENGMILEVNRAATTILGLESRFLVGKPLASFVAEKGLRAFREELNRVARSASADTTELEIVLQKRGGETFNVALTVAPARSRKGDRVTLRWMMRDVTERKQAERQIRALNAELEERVRQRTAELEQVNALKDELLAREQKARADAEAANRGKDEFLALVSHELRTPLNAMLGWTQLLRSGIADDSEREHALEVVERNAMAQKQMINDILDVSRIVTSNLHLEKGPLDLATVIEGAVEAERPVIIAKGIRLEQVLDRSIGPILGDAIRLQQIIGNLLSNSIKFTPNGGKIQVRLERAGSMTQITVSDTGCGIKPEFLPYVFDRFRQADSASTRVQGGLGLGLAIVSSLVKMHGGRVQARSDGEGKGATFIVTLPLAVEVKPGDRQAPDYEYPDLAEHSEILRGVWVVVVDDEPDARELLSVILRGAGARVTAVGTCAEALGVIEGSFNAGSTRPDVLVSDIAMSGEDGFDLIRALRNLEPERGGRIPAIALTAYAGDDDRSQVLIEGYQMHLAKPVALTSLVAAVANLAGKNAKSTTT